MALVDYCYPIDCVRRFLNYNNSLLGTKIVKESLCCFVRTGDFLIAYFLRPFIFRFVSFLLGGAS